MRLITTIVTDGVALKLASVPGSARFSFPTGGADSVVAATHPGDATYVIDVSAPANEPLAVRITDVPGWQASADGHRVTLTSAPGDLQSVTVPAGTRSLVLSYRPSGLAEGFDLALAALVLLAGFAVFEAVTLRRRVLERALDWTDEGPLASDPGPLDPAVADDASHAAVTGAKPPPAAGGVPPA